MSANISSLFLSFSLSLFLSFYFSLSLFRFLLVTDEYTSTVVWAQSIPPSLSILSVNDACNKSKWVLERTQHCSGQSFPISLSLNGPLAISIHKTDIFLSLSSTSRVTFNLVYSLHVAEKVSMFRGNFFSIHSFSSHSKSHTSSERIKEEGKFLYTKMSLSAKKALHNNCMT